MLSDLAANQGFGLDDLIVTAAAGLVLLVLIAAVVMAMRPKRPVSARQYDAELFKRRLALDEAGFDCVHDVRIADGRGGALKVDAVVRLPASIALITSAPPDVAGPVKVHPNAGTWRYIGAEGKISQFVNPVVQLHGLIHAIRQRYPLVKVRMLTVFPKAAELGSQPPRIVCLTETLVKSLKDMATEDGAPSQAVDAAWEPLAVTLKNASSQAARAGANKTGSGTGTARRRAVS